MLSTTTSTTSGFHGSKPSSGQPIQLACDSLFPVIPSPEGKKRILSYYGVEEKNLRQKTITMTPLVFKKTPVGYAFTNITIRSPDNNKIFHVTINKEGTKDFFNQIFLRSRLKNLTQYIIPIPNPKDTLFLALNMAISIFADHKAKRNNQYQYTKSAFKHTALISLAFGGQTFMDIKKHLKTNNPDLENFYLCTSELWRAYCKEQYQKSGANFFLWTKTNFAGTVSYILDKIIDEKDNFENTNHDTLWRVAGCLFSSLLFCLRLALITRNMMRYLERSTSL